MDVQTNSYILFIIQNGNLRAEDGDNINQLFFVQICYSALTINYAVFIVGQ